jgi:molybdopterin synthase sulfur carrier subunit
MLEELTSKYPKLIEKLCDEQGNLRNLIGIYRNDQDIRSLDGKKTPIAQGDEIHLVPVIAGG